MEAALPAVRGRGHDVRVRTLGDAATLPSGEGQAAAPRRRATPDGRAARRRRPATSTPPTADADGHGPARRRRRRRPRTRRRRRRQRRRQLARFTPGSQPHRVASVLENGTKVAGYEIEGILGHGGMGVVYEARQLALGRKVALKILAGTLGMDPSFKERFRNEGRIQAGDRPPAHRHRVRGRRVGGLAVHRDAARARPEPQGDDHRPRARGRADAADPAPDRRGARRRARGGADPPRHQAAEHPRRRARPRLPRRLRPHQGHRRRRADPDRAVRGHDRLHLAGADPRRDDDERVRHLRARGRALRVPDRRGALPEALGRGGHVRPPVRAAAAGHRAAPRAAAEPRRGHLQGDGQGPGGAPRDRHAR